MLRAIIVLLSMFLGVDLALAQQDWGMCPAGSTAVYGGGGTMCQCPDGSYAGMSGCQGNYQSQPQGNYCPSGGICAFGTTCCGNLCCNEGSRCTANSGCLPVDADDCGGGQWCGAGTQCWTSPANIGSISRGQLKCVTTEQAAQLERGIAEQLENQRQLKIAAEAEARRKEEERKEAIRLREEEKRQEIQRKRDEEQRRIAEAKRQQQEQLLAKQLAADAAARKKVEDTLLQQSQQQKQAELQKTAKLRDQELQNFMAPPANCDCNCKKLYALANGQNANSIICSNVALPPKASTVPITPTVQDQQWQKQLEYLKQNQVRLQPPLANAEQRKIVQPAVAMQKNTATSACKSTFMCGVPPNQYVCPCEVGPTPQSAARSEAGGASSDGNIFIGTANVNLGGDKLNTGFIGVGKTATYSLREEQGQVLGVNTRLNVLMRISLGQQPNTSCR